RRAELAPGQPVLLQTFGSESRDLLRGDDAPAVSTVLRGASPWETERTLIGIAHADPLRRAARRVIGAAVEAIGLPLRVRHELVGQAVRRAGATRVARVVRRDRGIPNGIVEPESLDRVRTARRVDVGLDAANDIPVLTVIDEDRWRYVVVIEREGDVP